MKKAMIYGGPNDGAEHQFEGSAPKSLALRLPVKGSKVSTTYLLSELWSAWFGRPVLIPAGFPGTPPHRELQTA